MASARLKVEAEATSRATPQIVWPLIADATRYAEWGPWNESGYERTGDDSPHGVGAVRRIRLGRTTTIERVTEVEEAKRLAYSVERGIPVRNYRAEVSLTPTAGGTQIRWVATFDRTPLGRIVERKLRTVYADVVAQLVAAADAELLAPSQAQHDEAG